MTKITLKIAANSSYSIFPAKTGLRIKINLSKQRFVNVFPRLSDDELMNNDNIIFWFFQGDTTTMDLVHNTGFKVAPFFSVGSGHILGKLEQERKCVLTL